MFARRSRRTSRALGGTSQSRPHSFSGELRQPAQSDIGSPTGNAAHLDEQPGIRGVRLELDLAHDSLLDRAGVHGGRVVWASIGEARKGYKVWLLARLSQEVNDGIGLPRKSNRAVAVPAPCTFRLRLTLGRGQPPGPQFCCRGHSSRAWASLLGGREARLRTAGS